MHPLVMLSMIFPVVHVGTFIAMVFHTVSSGKWGLFILTIVGFYLIPPMLLRLQNIFRPIKGGVHEFSYQIYNPWFGAYCLQSAFWAIPQFESLLRLIPGVYSAWLRLWGSKIGKGVYWTPVAEILDRSMIEVGDYVVVGHHNIITCHLISGHETKSGLRLFLAYSKVGEHVLLGGEVRVGPGAVILPRTLVKYGTICKARETYGKVRE